MSKEKTSVKNVKSAEKSQATAATPKPTAKELEKLKREVYIQNRKLLLACVGIFVFAALILYSASHIATWLTPTPWSYDNAKLEVLDGKLNENQYVYNNLIFARETNTSLWTFQGNIRTKLYEITMYHGPNEVMDIKSPDLAFAQIYSKKAVVLTLNTDLDNVPQGAAYGAIAAIELGKILGTKNDILNKVTMSALTNITTPNSTQVAVTCANASKEVGVIQFELANQTQIVIRPNCVVIRGSQPTELLRAADRFAYSLLGIIPLEAKPRTVASQNVTTAQNETLNDLTVPVDFNLTNITDLSVV